MLKEAIAYPRTGDRWLRRIGIGGLVIITSFLLVPVFVFFGYTVRILRAVAAGHTTPPDFDDITALIVDGVKFYGITLAYGLPVILIPLFAGAFGQALGLGTAVAESNPGAGPIATSILGLLLLASTVAGVVSVYSVPAAVSHFAYTGSMKAAFDVSTVVGTVSFSRPYLKAYLLTAVIGIVLFPVVAALSVVLVGIFIAVYQTLATGYLIGTGYAVSRDLPQDGHTDTIGATPTGTDQQTIPDTAGQREATTMDKPTHSTAATTKARSGTCPECGRSLGAEASFCPDCGTALTHTDNAVEDTSADTDSSINTPETAGHQTTGQDATAQRDEKTANPQSATQATHEPAPQTAQEPDETDPDDASGSDTQGEADSAASPAQVSQDQLYTDETGATYVETALGPDKRLHVDSDGQHYYQRGQAMRAVSGGFAILCAGFALFAFFILPGLGGGPNAPRGRILFALVEAIPFGNVIVGLLAIWIGYHLAYIAYTGREYMDVDNPD